MKRTRAHPAARTATTHGPLPAERRDGGEPLLNTAALARYLGVRPQTLRKWRLAGTGPAYIRLGEGLRAAVAYRWSDLEEWLDERTFRNTGEETPTWRGEEP